MNKWIGISFIILILIITSIIFVYIVKSSTEQNNDQNVVKLNNDGIDIEKNSTQFNSSEFSPVSRRGMGDEILGIKRSSGKYTYFFNNEFIGGADVPSVERFLRINNENGDVEVIIDDVYEKYGKYYSILDYDTGNANIIVIGAILNNFRQVPSPIEVIDVDTLEIKLLKINDVFSTDRFAAGKYVSPDGTKMVFIPGLGGENTKGNFSKMYLVDIVNDEYNLITEVNNNESFNMHAMQNEFYRLGTEVEWIDNENIIATVYETTKEEGNRVSRYEKINVSNKLVEQSEGSTEGVGIKQLGNMQQKTDDKIAAKIMISATVMPVILCMNDNGYIMSPKEDSSICRGNDADMWPSISNVGAEWGGCEMSVKRVDDVVHGFEYCAVLSNDSIAHCTDMGCEFE